MSLEQEDGQRIRSALSAIPICVWEWELATDRIVSLHDELGICGDSGQEPFRWIHAEDLDRVREAAARVAAGESPAAVEFRIVPPGGLRWCTFRARLSRGANGQPTHLCGVTLDVTESKLAVEAAAQEVSRAKDEFLAMLDHELRTPLTPARTLAQVLAGDESLAPEHRAVAAEIGTHIGFEKRLIDNLLSSKCLTHDQVQLYLTSVDINRKARHALTVCAPLIQNKRISVVESLAAADPFVLGDALLLRQVLWNLVQNAIRFVPPGGKICVRTANPEPGVLVLEVEDDSHGIEPGMWQRIFEELERAGRRPDSLEGLGLGLAVSRRIAELHGGTLTTASPGGGGRAAFRLRLATAGAAGATTHPQAAAPPFTEPPGADRPFNILLLEDDPATARALARLLKSHGHTVKVASGVSAAERAVAAERFDLFLCDLLLSEGHGLEFLPRVRHHLRRWADGGAEAPALVLSSFARESDVARSLAAGYVAHLVKPVDEDELLAAIRRAMANGQPKAPRA